MAGDITLNLSYRNPVTDALESNPLAPAPFIPLLAEDFSGGVVGTGYPGFEQGTLQHSRYANDQPSLPGQSLKITMDQFNVAGGGCGGNVVFGGRIGLPVNIPVGKWLWVMFRRYHPATQAWGYCYGGGDAAAAAICGKDADGIGVIKDMVLSPDNLTGRIYLQPENQRRALSLVSNSMRISIEEGASGNHSSASTANFPMGQWFTSQLGVFVQKNGTGIVRSWINGTLINEFVGQNINATATAIAEWGIGTYWNGVPYTDAAANRNYFWLKEVIIATDVDGYGAPTGMDNLGNTFIDPNTTVADL